MARTGLPVTKLTCTGSCSHRLSSYQQLVERGLVSQTRRNSGQFRAVQTPSSEDSGPFGLRSLRTRTPSLLTTMSFKALLHPDDAAALHATPPYLRPWPVRPIHVRERSACCCVPARVATMILALCSLLTSIGLGGVCMYQIICEF